MKKLSKNEIATNQKTAKALAERLLRVLDGLNSEQINEAMAELKKSAPHWHPSDV